MKKFTTIFLVLTAIVLVLNSVKGLTILVLFPLATILIPVLIGLNLLVRKLEAAYPRKLSWIYIAFWWLAFSFWPVYIFAEAIGANGSGRMVFMVPLSSETQAEFDPIFAQLENISCILVLCAIVFFIIVVSTYKIAIRKQGAAVDAGSATSTVGAPNAVNAINNAASNNNDVSK